MNNKNVNALIARGLSGLNCTRSLTMNSKFSIPHEAAECGIEISRSLLVNSNGCDQASLYFRGGKVRLIQLLDYLSVASPESGLSLIGPETKGT